MKYHLRLIAVLIIGWITSSTPVAASDAERAALAHILHELNALEPLIQQAEVNAEQDARVHVRYDWLRQDLHQIRDGIQAHIDEPRAQPRTFPPLRGDYRR